MRRSRITSYKSKASIRTEESFSFSAFVLKFWPEGPLYLPALRATGDRPPEGRLKGRL